MRWFHEGSNDKEESEHSPLFSFKSYYFTLFSKLRMEKEVISPTADQRESKSWNQRSKESSSLPVNPSAQRYLELSLTWSQLEAWGQFDSLPVLPDKYALCFQNLFNIKRSLTALWISKSVLHLNYVTFCWIKHAAALINQIRLKAAKPAVMSSLRNDRKRLENRDFDKVAKTKINLKLLML